MRSTGLITFLLCVLVSLWLFPTFPNQDRQPTEPETTQNRYFREIFRILARTLAADNFSGDMLTLTYVWNFAQYRLARRTLNRHNPRYWIRLFSRVGGAIFLTLGLFLMQHFLQKGAAILSLEIIGSSVMILLGLWSVALSPLYSYSRMKTRFLSMQEANQSIVWKVDADTLSMARASQQDIPLGDYLWKDIIRVVETRHAFVIYPETTSFLWLPLKAFPNDQDLTQFRTWAQTKALRYYKD